MIAIGSGGLNGVGLGAVAQNQKPSAVALAVAVLQHLTGRKHDAYLIGLTATPSKQTFGFFNQNLVMEYGHEEAVADGVNVN